VEGVVEVSIEEGLGIRNREDWNDFGKDGEEESLGFCKKILDDPLFRIISSAVRGHLVLFC